jgi:hypothetical protein
MTTMLNGYGWVLVVVGIVAVVYLVWRYVMKGTF